MDKHKRVSSEEDLPSQLTLQVDATGNPDELSTLRRHYQGLLAREQRYKKEILNLQRRLKLESKLQEEKVKNTLAFKLGTVLLQATNSVSGLLALPRGLWEIRAESQRRAARRILKANGEFGPKSTVQAGSHAAIRKSTPHVLSSETAGRRLKVAAVMDEFTFHSYNQECELIQLNAFNWQEQLNEFVPDLLFIESAWKGEGGSWQGMISNNAQSLIDMLKYANEKGIPSLFWNKEDPVHFSTFLAVAAQVDYVFTTDIDCIPKYKKSLGHDRVYLLPFAAQPFVHNPVEIYDRKDAFNFAGSYYLRYPERQRDFSSLIDAVQDFRAVEIYDRNYENPHPHYEFPEKYKPLILGSLAFKDIDKAYKGYAFGINMNTIKQSQTMFARRVFELLASNTVIVSNFSRGVRTLFGDLVVSSDDRTQLVRRLADICKEEVFGKFRLLGLRKVMSEHTYAHRLAYIRAKLSNGKVFQPENSILVAAIANSMEDAKWIISNFKRQRHLGRELCLFANFPNAELESEAHVKILTSNQEFWVEVARRTPLHEFVAIFGKQDYYGENYLVDMVLAGSYSKCGAFTKGAYYASEEGRLVLKNGTARYRGVRGSYATSTVFRTSTLNSINFSAILFGSDSKLWEFESILAIDEFNYCKAGRELLTSEVQVVVDDLILGDQGLSVGAELLTLAEALSPQRVEFAKGAEAALPELSAAQLHRLFGPPRDSNLETSLSGSCLKIRSSLPEDKHAYIYAVKKFSREEINLVLNSQFRLDAKDVQGNVRTVFEFLDGDNRKISHSIIGNVGGKHSLAIPSECRKVRFGLRLQGNASAKISRLVLGSEGERAAVVVAKSKCLVVTKQYPAYDDLYKYGFLHSRIRAYRRSNVHVDVFRLRSGEGHVYSEFEGVDVVTGDSELLDATLATGQYEHVLVHLMDEKMWLVLKKYSDKINITVWIHGAEIQLWQRREFEFERFDTNEISRQKKLSDKRHKFWTAILKDPPPNTHFVFVSKYFLDEVEQDYQIPVPRSNLSIIHNFIDNTVFNYEKKDASARKRVLSVRPYASRKYANDLTVSAILELSKRPCFKDMEFGLYGDGDLFDSVTEPLQQFDNVRLEKRFLSQEKIAELHKEFGVFLTPTRMDAQGVSRDEAMLSGLVPITNAVAAIPEFVDETCGIVVDAEDFVAMADAMERLYWEPDLFEALSKNASDRVAAQCGLLPTIGREIELIGRRISAM